MIEFVYGGSGSGKSEFAENEILRLSSGFASKRFYIATMKVFDDEARQKVARHRNLRAEKKFITIEACRNLENAAETILQLSESAGNAGGICKASPQSLPEAVPAAEKKSCVLLECLSNLAANEMFLEDGGILGMREAAGKIEAGLEKLFSAADDIVIVSNNVFDDGIDYGKTTREYQKVLAAVNAFAARRADKVSEIVAGIEVRIK